MANPTIFVHSADKTIQEISASSPLAVEAVTTDETEVTLTYITGTKAAAGGNELIPAPGVNNRIVVNMFSVQNESANQTTVLLMNGASSVFRALLSATGSAISASFEKGREWKLSANSALNLNLSGANSHGYMVAYYIESV